MAGKWLELLTEIAPGVDGPRSCRSRHRVLVSDRVSGPHSRPRLVAQSLADRRARS